MAYIAHLSPYLKIPNYKSLPCNALTVPILLYQMRMSTNFVSSVMLRSRNLEIRNNVKTVQSPRNHRTDCHEMKPICRRIELCMREIILHLEMTESCQVHFSDLMVLKMKILENFPPLYYLVKTFTPFVASSFS
jgi:hypothetical protein